MDAYSQFTPAQLVTRIREYWLAYHSAERDRNIAEARVADLLDECGNLQHARDTQEELVQAAQDESDAIKRSAESFRVRAEIAMNKE